MDIQIGFGHVSKHIWARKIGHPNQGYLNDDKEDWRKDPRKNKKQVQFAMADSFSVTCKVPPNLYVVYKMTGNSAEPPINLVVHQSCTKAISAEEFAGPA